jgi:hypothetical protein
MRRTRVTVRLDPDLVSEIRALARREGISFSKALNRAARAGLRARRGPRPPVIRYTQPMGLRPGIDLDKALGIAAALEDAEIARKQEERG